MAGLTATRVAPNRDGGLYGFEGKARSILD
jgi:hypothetical protein